MPRRRAGRWPRGAGRARVAPQWVKAKKWTWLQNAVRMEVPSRGVTIETTAVAGSTLMTLSGSTVRPLLHSCQGFRRVAVGRAAAVPGVAQSAPFEVALSQQGDGHGWISES